MPFEGAGYVVHPDWRSRDHRYATEGVARWLTGVFREVTDTVPGSVAYLGDISSRRGGDVAKHRSHASGRDVDIFYFACDSAGRPLHDLPAMLHFGGDGRAQRWSVGRAGRVVSQPVPEAQFDARRNWALVRAMLSNPAAEVQWIFIHRDLAVLLLAEAEREGADPAVVVRALALLHQPTDSQPHDDHMHVRLFCDPEDRFLGCTDRGPKRWLKKHWKYMRSGEAHAGLWTGQVATATGPQPESRLPRAGKGGREQGASPHFSQQLARQAVARASNRVGVVGLCPTEP